MIPDWHARTVEPHDRAKARKLAMSDVRILDGDTVEVTIRATIRLQGLDCPELGSRDGYRAKAFTADWLAKYAKSVRLIVTGVEPKYGRVLGRIVRQRGADLAESLLAAGLARRWV